MLMLRAICLIWRGACAHGWSDATVGSLRVEDAGFLRGRLLKSKRRRVTPGAQLKGCASGFLRPSEHRRSSWRSRQS